MSALIPAVVYLRMSSDQQTASIERQRIAVWKWAKENGYQILREYIDEGISGWRNDRAAFQQLISDAPKRAFKAVLCWDQDRFSRFPPLEANHYWYLLDSAGVHLATCNQGRIDWASLAGWLTASISQHAKAEYSRDLGKNVADGQRKRKMQGQWIGKAPLGYQLGENGFLELGDPAEVALIRRIFHLRANGVGTKTIAATLNKEGVSTPRGALWSSQGVRHILQRDAYLGKVVIGKWARGKYARIVEGRHEVLNTHPALIDQATWDAVRATQLAKHRKRHNGDGEGAPLAGLLFCGDCKAPLYSQRFRVYGTAHYLCRTYHSNGGCHCNRVDQEPLHKLVLEKIQAHICHDDMELVRKRVEQKLAARASKNKELDTKAIHRQIAGIDKKISTATERLVTVAPSLVAMIEKKMLEFQEQRNSLCSLLNEQSIDSAELTIERVLSFSQRLRDTLKTGQPSQIRNALSKIVQSITIRFEDWKTTSDGRKWRRPCGGVICLFTNGVQLLGETCHIGEAQITLSRRELACCIKERAWNFKGGQNSVAL